MGLGELVKKGKFMRNYFADVEWRKFSNVVENDICWDVKADVKQQQTKERVAVSFTFL